MNRQLEDLVSARLADGSFVLSLLQEVIRKNYLEIKDYKVFLNSKWDTRKVSQMFDCSDTVVPAGKNSKKNSFNNLKVDYRYENSEDNEKAVEQIKLKIVNCIMHKENSVTLVLGSPGSGKTACVEEAIRRAQKECFGSHNIEHCGSYDSCVHGPLDVHKDDSIGAGQTFGHHMSGYFNDGSYGAVNDNTNCWDMIFTFDNKYNHDQRDICKIDDSSNINKLSNNDRIYRYCDYSIDAKELDHKVDNDLIRNANCKDMNDNPKCNGELIIIRIGNSGLYKNDWDCLSDIIKEISETVKCRDFSVRNRISMEEDIETLTHILKDTSTYSDNTVLLVLDGFEKFCNNEKQALLYSLFDLQHSKAIHLCILCVSSVLKVPDFLEKRVRSRLALQWILVKDICSPHTIIAYIRHLLWVRIIDVEKVWQLRRAKMPTRNFKDSVINKYDLDKIDADRRKILQFVVSFNYAVAEELSQKILLEKIEFKLNSGRNLVYFLNSAVDSVLSLLPIPFCRRNDIVKKCVLYEDEKVSQKIEDDTSDYNTIIESQLYFNEYNEEMGCTNTEHDASFKNTLKRSRDELSPVSVSPKITKRKATEIDMMELHGKNSCLNMNMSGRLLYNKYHHDGSMCNTQLQRLNGGIVFSNFHKSYLRRVFIELNEIEHLILAALCRIHYREIIPKNLATVLEEISDLFTPKYNILSPNVSNFNRIYSTMSFRRAFLRLLDMNIIEISISQEKRLKGFKFEILNDFYAAFLPIKFSYYQLYSEMIPCFRLSTTVETWIHKKVPYNK